MRSILFGISLSLLGTMAIAAPSTIRNAIATVPIRSIAVGISSDDEITGLVLIDFGQKAGLISCPTPEMIVRLSRQVTGISVAWENGQYPSRDILGEAAGWNEMGDPYCGFRILPK